MASPVMVPLRAIRAPMGWLPTLGHADERAQNFVLPVVAILSLGSGSVAANLAAVDSLIPVPDRLSD
jgi:hypothetical protein